jgi:hypothetical protein
MSLKNNLHQAQDRISSVRLASNPLRIPVEQIVSEHRGRPWTIKDARDMTEFACHPCAILSDGSYSVFAKLSEAANGFEQFEIELAGLRLLRERSGVLTPTPIGIVPVTGEISWFLRRSNKLPEPLATGDTSGKRLPASIRTSGIASVWKRMVTSGLCTWITLR